MADQKMLRKDRSEKIVADKETIMRLKEHRSLGKSLKGKAPGVAQAIATTPSSVRKNSPQEALKSNSPNLCKDQLPPQALSLAQSGERYKESNLCKSIKSASKLLQSGTS